MATVGWACLETAFSACDELPSVRARSGFDALTTGVSAFRVVSSPANVVVERCSTPGSRSSDCFSAALAGDRACAWLVLEISCVSSLLLRCERLHRLRALDEQPVERWLVASELLGHLARAGQARRQVLKRPVGGLPCPSSEAASPWMRFARPLRVVALSESNSSSRLTSEYVSPCADRPAGLDRGRAAAAPARARRTWRRCPTASPRRSARPCPDGACADAVQVQRHLGQAVGGQPDAGDRADGRRADQDVVAGHEAARVLEVGLDRVRGARAEHEDHDHDHGRQQRAGCTEPRSQAHARTRHAPPTTTVVRIRNRSRTAAGGRAQVSSSIPSRAGESAGILSESRQRVPLSDRNVVRGRRGSPRPATRSSLRHQQRRSDRAAEVAEPGDVDRRRAIVIEQMRLHASKIRSVIGCPKRLRARRRSRPPRRRAG